ncbi:NADH-quinone oxidoreductase subunit N [Rubrivivax sp. A210]|uniref:NADH-quinone oxidoreductase subunit N n=1 Tax=Rubrivivax sp. A210 TaxID=2772301 RepID=UPI00191AF05F|nr:NADH-quinone oxidoreductase subunit N [Rubrivivax sp. A210]CAD5375055.1 NADH-quinone oxidoreductase subunit N [Rubrivivax sp. A210]
MNAQAILTAMLPEHLLLAGIVLLVILEITGQSKRGALPVTLLAVAAAAVAAACLALAGYSGAPFAGQFSVSPGPLLAKALVLALALPVVLIAGSDFGPEGEHGGEFGVLLLSALYGTCLMQSADSFMTLFLGLEIMSLPVYVLVLLAWRRPQAAEAALKYLVLGGAASATLLMGASLLYGASGSLAIATFAQALASTDPMVRAAVVLVLLAFFLKAAIVPFHAWAPDAYEGASVPVTAFMAVIVKAAVMLAAVRLFGDGKLVSPLLEIVAVLPLVSIVWGNLAAMRQPNLRRMIAYSSIAHAGYLFYAFLGEPAGRLQAVAFYLLAYGLLNLLVFTALPPAADDGERDKLDNLKGLFHRNPFAALMIGLAMLSLAGIPPLPGFVGKFLIFKNVIAAGYPVYAVLGLVGSFLGIYFYLRVIQFMFMSPDAEAPVDGPVRGVAVTASLACLAAALVVAVFPGWVMGHW